MIPSLPSSLEALPTPCLLLDRGRLRANVERMAEVARRGGVALRPHLKTAKAVEVARLATAGQPGGITVSTLAEAAFFAAAGFRDLTWALSAQPAKLDQAAGIQARYGARLGLIVDSPVLALEIQRAAAALGARFAVHVEIDSGEHRTGLAWDDPAVRETAAAIAAGSALELAGVLTHGGHAYDAQGTAALEAVAEEERLAVVRAAAALREAGLSCPVVSAGSTPTALHARSFEGLTEIRPGVYTLMDLAQLALGCCRAEDIAVSVLSTVIGRQPAQRRLVLDAGALALSKDLSAAGRLAHTGYGWLVDVREQRRLGSLHLERLDQEHGYVTGDAASLAALPLLSRVRVLPNHACITAACHPGYWVVDGETVVDWWPRARGWQAGPAPGARGTLRPA